MKRYVQTALLLLLALEPSLLRANGFDYTFEAFSGDLNSDGATDLFVRGRSSAFVPISIEDISVPIAFRAVPREFVIHGKTTQQPSWVKTSLTEAEKSTVSTWPKAGVTLTARDFNADGAIDLGISGLSFRDLVFASSSKGVHDPIGHNSLSESERVFLKTVGDWLIDPSTLNSNQYKVVGVDPPTRIWHGYFRTNTPSPAGLTNLLVTRCPVGKTCAITTTPPTDSCVRVVDKYDSQAQYIGTEEVDVCPFPLHVWAYEPGSITLAVNSAFHQDAVTFINSFEDILGGSTTSLQDLTASLALASSYLGMQSPIGSSGEQCEDAPVAQQLGVSGLGPLIIPAGYGVYYCAAATVMVIAAIFTRTHDIDPANETTMYQYTGGLATTPMPHGHIRELEALRFNPDPFGDDCDPPPPSRTGKLRENYNVLNDTAAWRRTDLNPNSPSYAGHRERIQIVERKRDELKKRYRDICGGEL